MATVIHSLWIKDDRGTIILPSTIPIDDPEIKEELTRYLDPNWKPIIDDTSVRLVILSTDHPHTKHAKYSPALSKVVKILDSRGTGLRIPKNTLVFLAPDETRLRELQQTACRYEAWKSILDEKDSLDLSTHQIR